MDLGLSLDSITSRLGPPDLLVHVAPHELVATGHGVDPCTEAVASAMQGHGGSIVTSLDPSDAFSEVAARAWAARGVFLVGVRVRDCDAAGEVGDAVLSAFHHSSQLAGSVRAVRDFADPRHAA